jgi:phage gp46-like protein
MTHSSSHSAGHLRDHEHFPLTDISVRQDDDGIFDIELDEDNQDAQLTVGLEAAIIVSLFSDRRAREDEVRNPMRRRGWIGDLLTDIPGDLHGSALWFYEQTRLTAVEAAGVAAEARNALQWMVDEELCNSVSVEVAYNPAMRAVFLNVTVSLLEGGVSQHAFRLADATRVGLAAQTTV